MTELGLEHLFIELSMALLSDVQELTLLFRGLLCTSVMHPGNLHCSSLAVDLFVKDGLIFKELLSTRSLEHPVSVVAHLEVAICIGVRRAFHQLLASDFQVLLLHAGLPDNCTGPMDWSRHWNPHGHSHLVPGTTCHAG